MKKFSVFTDSSVVQVSLLFILHGLLGVLIARYPIISPVHCLGTIALGFFVGLSKQNKNFPIYVSAYIVGSEVLWRMSGRPVFYEIAKYAVAAILLVAYLQGTFSKNQKDCFYSPFFVLSSLTPIKYSSFFNPPAGSCKTSCQL